MNITPRYERGSGSLILSGPANLRRANMKVVIFENQFNKSEKFYCDNLKNVQLIDGVEYLHVRRLENSRKFLIRKDSLKKIEEKRI